MILSEVDLGQKNIAFGMNYFLEQDENNKTISDICVKESKRLGCNLLSLEEICDFVVNNNINFDYLINEIAYMNKIDINTIGFTVYPITLYENTLIRDFALELINEGSDIFIASDPRADVSYAFDIILKECIEYDSTGPLDHIINTCFNGYMYNLREENETENSVVNKAKTLLKDSLDSGKRAKDQIVNKIDSTIHSLGKYVRTNPLKRDLYNSLINKLTDVKRRLLS